MEAGTIIGALIFFFIIVPTMFPKTYKKANDVVSKWADDDAAKLEAKKAAKES